MWLLIWEIVSLILMWSMQKLNELIKIELLLIGLEALIFQDFARSSQRNYTVFNLSIRDLKSH